MHPRRFNLFSLLQRQNSFRRGRILQPARPQTERAGIAALDAWNAQAALVAVERESILHFVKTTAAGMV
jgi:hypothetical protein